MSYAQVVICLLVSGLFLPVNPAQAPTGDPVFEILREGSSIKFAVKASVPIEGTFDKWDATLTYPSTDVEAGVLDIRVEAASVNTGSGKNDGKLKGKDFFDVKDNPYITFRSSKIVQTGPNTVDVQGTFTIRGVSKPETLNISGFGEKGSGSGEITGTMNSGIPFTKIADRAEVSVDLLVKRVLGPPLVFKQ